MNLARRVAAIRAIFICVPLAMLVVGATGCATLAQKPAPSQPEPVNKKQIAEEARSKIVTKVILKADNERIDRLEREIERLKAELARAEQTLIAVESGLQSGYTRADAVKSLAEAQINLEKTMGFSPWHDEKIVQAQEKLKTARSHIDAGRFGAGLFFVYRVNSIVRNVNDEADAIRTSPNLLFVNKPRANLRTGPSTNHKIVTTLTQETPLFLENRSGKWVLVRTLSGTVGWMHAGLVSRNIDEAKGG